MKLGGGHSSVLTLHSDVITAILDMRVYLTLAPDKLTSMEENEACSISSTRQPHTHHLKRHVEETETLHQLQSGV